MKKKALLFLVILNILYACTGATIKESSFPTKRLVVQAKPIENRVELSLSIEKSYARTKWLEEKKENLPPRVERQPVLEGTLEITSIYNTSFKPNSSGIFSIPIKNLDPWQSNFDFEYHEPSGKTYYSQFSFNWYYEFSDETLLKTGDEAFDKEEFYKAVGFYQKANHQEKASLALVKAGEKALKEKDFSNATDYFEKAGQTERASEIYILQGEEALKNKNFDTAINYFKKAHAKDKIKKAYEAKLNSKGIENVFGDTMKAWGNLEWGMDINDAEGVLRSEGFVTPQINILDYGDMFQKYSDDLERQFNLKKTKMPEKKFALKKDNIEITCYFFELEQGYWPLYQVSVIYDESRITVLKIAEGRGSPKYINLELFKKLQLQYGKPTLLNTKNPSFYGKGQYYEFEIKSYQWDDGYSSIEIQVSRMITGAEHISGEFDPAIYYTNNALWDFCNPNPENKPVVQEEKEEPLYYKKKEKPYKEKWERDLDRKLEEIQRKFERDMEKTMRDLERSFR